MSVTITVHRGTNAIGGSCIELVAGNGERLILDAGRPLDAPNDTKGLLPDTLDLAGPATVLFSHPHMDHWGLIDDLPAHWQLWTGQKSAELMRLTKELFGGSLDREITCWDSRGSFEIGRFRVTPYLTDHSAYDAYMLLIEAEGRRILYTGDFRAHGRKAKLVEAMIARPPANLDVLLMEGTNVGTDKPTITEDDLEEKFVELAMQTRRHVFVQWSAQNIDRTVTLSRVAKRTGRKLVVDLYGADVLNRVASGSRIPVPGGQHFPELKVVITGGGKYLYGKQGRTDFVDAMASSAFGISRKRLIDDRAIIMLRDSMIRDFERGGLMFTPDDAYAFSNWSGYLDIDNLETGWAKAAAAGAKTLKLHTSGHASPTDLSRFAGAMNPKALIPVHGLNWDNPGIALPPVARLADGEAWEIV